MCRLMRSARTALLTGCMSLLTIQQFGHGTNAVLDVMFVRSDLPSAHAISTDESAAKGPTLSCDILASICEAVLTERKARILSSSGQPKPPAPRSLEIFHNNCRPVVLHKCAVFCDFARLRHILHPHISLIAHTSSVLC